MIAKEWKKCQRDSFWIAATILTSGVGISIAKFIAEDVNDERVSSYLLNGQIIQLILAAAFIFILILLSLFVLPTMKYSDLAMPLVIVFGSKRDSMVNYMIINKLEQLYFNLFKEGSRVKDKSFYLTKKRTMIKNRTLFIIGLTKNAGK